MTQLVHELHPDILVELAGLLGGASEGDVNTLRRSVSMDSDGGNNGVSFAATHAGKNLEVVSMQLQRKNANNWNAFVSVILHEEDEPEERTQRPRLPSV